MRVPAAQPLAETARIAPPPELDEAVIETRTRILETTKRDSLRAFSRLADASDGFVSNFSDSNHHGHWSLLRRTGVDPLRQIEHLFGLQHGQRTVGSEVWYIWPDFAAMTPEELLPERLGFQDRARLLELVGEAGIEDIRQGATYMGIRTAISAKGRWVYYLHDIGAEEAAGDERED